MGWPWRRLRGVSTAAGRPDGQREILLGRAVAEGREDVGTQVMAFCVVLQSHGRFMAS